MLIHVTSTDQTFDISISDGGASVVLGAGAWPPPKVGSGWGVGVLKFLGLSCMLDTFYGCSRVEIDYY
jgi:hypothetical protein